MENKTTAAPAGAATQADAARGFLELLRLPPDRDGDSRGYLLGAFYARTLRAPYTGQIDWVPTVHPADGTAPAVLAPEWFATADEATARARDLIAQRPNMAGRRPGANGYPAEVGGLWDAVAVHPSGLEEYLWGNGGITREAAIQSAARLIAAGVSGLSGCTPWAVERKPFTCV